MNQKRKNFGTGLWVGERGGREWRESRGERWEHRRAKREDSHFDKRSDNKPRYHWLLLLLSMLCLLLSSLFRFLSCCSSCFCCYPFEFWTSKDKVLIFMSSSSLSCCNLSFSFFGFSSKWWRGSISYNTVYIILSTLWLTHLMCYY